MTPQEQELLQRFLEDFKQAPKAPIDTQAEHLIKQAVAARPDSAYLLVQQTLLQRLALEQAQARTDELQKALNESQSTMPAPTSGSFLSGLTRNGWGQPQTANASPMREAYTAQQTPPPPAARSASGGGVSSFLQSAATTAAGVAGGALLLQGVESLLGRGGSTWGGGWGGMPGGFTEHNTVINEYVNADPQSDRWESDRNDVDSVNSDFDSNDDSSDMFDDNGNDDNTWV